MLADVETVKPGLWLALVLFVVIRPLTTMISLAREPLSRTRRGYIAWFGIRGAGSVYYLAYALTHGLAGDSARQLADMTLVVVAASIVIHGASVTPLMRRFSHRHARDRHPHRLPKGANRPLA